MVTSANTSYVASGIEQTEVEMKTPFQVPLALCSYVDLDAWGDWAIFDPDDEENTHKTIASFVLFLLEVYKQEDLAGQELWSRFRSDFEGWTTATFRKAVSAILKLLRDFLLYRGVWIPIDNSQIRNNLLRVVQENDYHVWTEEEIQDTSKRSPIFRTLALNSNFVEDLQAQPLTVEDIRLPPKAA
ncbi:hypothetical protein CDEST_01273 [Colletotrichum destructivum]|uniref:Uncharacterized protein n=1 Tax=Colletotrichum destructivum TaxID=34406 RepID=A0AAX4HZ88_9PEZI|nr:hypothetical protein CDEST_01273 [Colletotrichum destructivum]